jgi:hypothetical protein
MVLCAYVSITLSVCLWGVLTLNDMTRGPRPLIDHTTTVSAYLNDYKSQTDSKIQDDYSQRFTCYLLSTCWQKIVRRIKSWQAMGFIRFLTTVPLEELQCQGQAWDQFPSHVGPGDRTLMALLCRVSESDRTVQSFLLDHIETSSHLSSSDIKDFLTICSSESSKPSALLFFSNKTILEFHGLVIAAFRGFARAFLQIEYEYSNLVRMDY